MCVLIQRLTALVLLILFLPFFLFLYLLVKLEDGGALIYRQKRMGRGKKPFVMYKFRTMVEGAEKLKAKYGHLNEADGPTFKIRNDPRHTRVGRLLTHTGLDELPQLINVLKGEMVLVGPRPLPWDEAKKIPNKYQKRFSVLPGITSPWVVKGSHSLSFKKWMELDIEYVDNRSFWQEILVIFLTASLMTKGMIHQLLKRRWN